MGVICINFVLSKRKQIFKVGEGDIKCLLAIMKIIFLR